jgi:hypothetical protein
MGRKIAPKREKMISTERRRLLKNISTYSVYPQIYPYLFGGVNK